MSSMKKYNKRTETSSVEFKRKLIMQVKKHSSVWKKCYIEKQDAWKIIESELGFLCSLKELQASWASLRAVYFRKIFIRTIERNFEAPKWIYFHDMTFLYDIVKENIQKKLGGISPPLFKPKQNQIGSQSIRCPCCIYDGPDLNSVPDLNSAPDLSSVEMEFKQEDEVGNLTNTTPETSFENLQETIENSIGSVDSESSSHSICSLDSENEACILTNSQEPQQSQAEDCLIQASSPDLLKTKTFEVIDLMDDTETSNESPDSQLQPASLESATDIHSSEDICHPLQSNRPIGLKRTVEPVKPLSSGLTDLITSFTMNGCLEEKSTLKEPESRSMKPTESSKPPEITPNKVLKPKKQIEVSAFQLRAIERTRIIEAIKDNPATYINYSKKKSFEQSLAWDRVAKAVGSISLHIIKNRWKIIKDRYLKELLYERYSNGMNKSMWECYEQLEFLRPYMQKDITEIHHTRIQMQDTIRKRAGKSINGVKCTSEIKEPAIEDGRTEISSIKNIAENTTNQQQFYNSDKSIVAYVNANQNIQIASVETVKKVKPIITLCTKAKPIEQPVVLDTNLLPILTNRPVKITAVQVLPSLDLTNEDDEDESNGTPPPTKKLRKSIGSKKTEANVHENETPKRLPSPLAVDLTTDDDIDESKHYAEAPPSATNIQKSKGSEKNQTNAHANAIPKRLPSTLALNFTNDDDEDESNGNAEAPSPTEKIRKSTGSEKNETTVPGNETAKRLPSPLAVDLTTDEDESNDNAEAPPPTKKLRRSIGSEKNEIPPASSLTLNLTSDEATTVQSQQLQPRKPQKVFPPLDLTIDDDDPVAAPKPALKINSTSKFQQIFEKELVNTNKLLSTFDLTIDEGKDQAKSSCNAKNGNMKNNENVICLDNDDSVGSYEEVIVHFAEKNKNR